MKSTKVYLTFLTVIMTFITTCLYSDIEDVVVQTQKNNNFSLYPHFTREMSKKMYPHLIHEKHPMKKNLDALFGKKRVTKNNETFLKAGFKILDQRPRSYVVVARHQKLKGYLIKCYFDNELREKWGRPSWKWLTNRCEGAKKIQKIIKQYKIKHFDVAKKWIYPLPLLDNKLPYQAIYQRHPALLLVTDMKLVPEEDNLHAWKNLVTKKMLKELYVIITLARGSSYRADNIAYSHSGKFCFIDTEYPSSAPDYERIAFFLNSDMRAYWYSLVDGVENVL